jgi:hypothetical protein
MKFPGSLRRAWNDCAHARRGGGSANTMTKRMTDMASMEQARSACDVPRAEQIARLDDTLRCKGLGGRIMITRGVRALPDFDVLTLLTALAAFDGFDVDNDPHGERDFGDVEVTGVSCLWKVDYYDRAFQFASADPADPTITERVLTVMLPEEW